MNKFSTTSIQDYHMTVNKLTVGINMPEALKSQGKGDDEYAHTLPPYHRRRAFLVDEYPACPADWLRSSGRIKSYFVPTRDGAGLWLDFNNCLDAIQHDVAIVVSVQGVNAVTGLPCKDAQLEQYRDECPKHKKAFGPDRLCADCGYKWPKQNYVCSTGTPRGHLWLDGFRAEDGKVRQYVFTKSVARSVAAAIIGGDRVHALGISFFLSKKQRPKMETTVLRANQFWGGKLGSLGDEPTYGASMNHSVLDMMSTSKSIDDDGPIACASAGETYLCSTSESKGLSDGGMKRMLSGPIGAKGPAGPAGRHSVMFSQVQQVEKLEVAAGARIQQEVHDDPCSLDDWQPEPEGLIIINYCTEADAERILAGGKVDLSGNPDGFLKNVPVGNP